MTIKATALTLATAIDLEPGAVFTAAGHWYLRADVSDRADVEPAAIPLSKGAEFHWLTADKCLALAPGCRYELRIIGPIKGAGKPDHTSLVWCNDGSLAVAINDYFIAFTGLETKDLNIRAGIFSVPHWGAWVLDADGNEVSPDPLFVIGAEQQ
ncbi:hypothetical protein [Xanthomonas citri]|uniref:hypothetical protein n=1 Tax=Xanthomonas citri TaxID=346 RepID=UPI000724BB39|nr:hypothetical protein [Xanthomonas citri]OOW50333.1 hypothetical protein BFQ41_18210 [Xanthomonas citri pv. citri]QYF42618.1 hypothetical protein HZS92_06147 [Xanthomonas citri pv. citri]QYF42757.1 hypothetical protein HZS92_07115 [Xanthomonas citri pv. citri]CEE16384.1 conserved hypothetical protein [Xanthomonas citri pv. citri]